MVAVTARVEQDADYRRARNILKQRGGTEKRLAELGRDGVIAAANRILKAQGKPLLGRP
jgi:hypothetical protein